MERNERGLSDKQKKAAKILFSILAFIVIGVCIILLFSPGRIWDKYADFVKILLIIAWLISVLFIIILVDSRDEKRFFKKTLIGWQLAYWAEAIYMFLVSGWWKEENINNIFDKEVFRSIGIGTEGYLINKILLLIFAAIAVWMILLGINYALGRFVDEFDESGTGNIITAIMNKVKANENKADAGNGNGGKGKEVTSGDKGKKDTNGDKGKEGTSGRNVESKLGWKHWLIVAIVGISLLALALITLPKVSDVINIVAPEWEESSILRPILEISKFIISFLVATIEAIVIIVLLGLAVRITTYVGGIIKKCFFDEFKPPKDWFINFLGWVIGIVIVYYIVKKLGGYEDVIESFKAQLGNSEFLGLFIAVIMLITVTGFLQIIISSIISIIHDGYVQEDKSEEEKGSEEKIKVFIKRRIKNIVFKLIKNALKLIENAVDLTEIIPNFILQAGDLIWSGENNPDELECIIVKSKRAQLEKEKENPDSNSSASVAADDIRLEIYEEYLEKTEGTAANTNTGNENKPNTTTDDTEEK